MPKSDRVTLEDNDDRGGEMLLEDSWEADNQNDAYEVERILDLRWVKLTRTSRRTCEYLIKWKGYVDPEWLPLSQVNDGTLLYEFNQRVSGRCKLEMTIHKSS
ncbi:hypothetical protein PHMEG_0006741 [Phytophthora megakarya]|uniref:Chromo domain-containing protein n=1 Tax=Phytophthora megakarya TaxID=4795 RepID=A0A225WN36_9STRA|nr:hypothetical protein PHMEG_0006741 [Phytophthora megakarya]